MALRSYRPTRKGEFLSGSLFIPLGIFFCTHRQSLAHDKNQYHEPWASVGIREGEREGLFVQRNYRRTHILIECLPLRFYKGGD